LNCAFLYWASFRLSGNTCVARHTITFIESGRLRQATLSRSPEVFPFLSTIDDRRPRHLRLHDIYDDRPFPSISPPFITFPPFLTDWILGASIFIELNSSVSKRKEHVVSTPCRQFLRSEVQGPDLPEVWTSMDRWTSILVIPNTHRVIREEYIHGTELIQSQERHFTTPTGKVTGHIILLDVSFPSSASNAFPATIGGPNSIRRQGTRS
jgi:hypothetical protein